MRSKSRWSKGPAEGAQAPYVGNDIDVAVGKDLQGTAQLGLAALVIGEQIKAAADGEIVVRADDRVEGGDFLLALGDEDAGHGRPFGWVCAANVGA